MAELNTGDGGGKKGGGKVRSKKQNSKVDLTAMVDLAFLLITFFMLTTSLSKPQSMDLGLPDTKDTAKTPDIKVDENRTLTFILGADDKVTWFKGLPNKPLIGPKEDMYGKDGIRKEILKQVKVVADYCVSIGKPKEGLIVIIKPTKKSTYKNLVDILDEMAICSVPTNAIVNEFSPEEKTMADKMNKSATP